MLPLLSRIVIGECRMKVMTEEKAPKVSKYVAAGSPRQCFLPTCRKAFAAECVRSEDGHYYCSEECAETGAQVDMTRVEELRPKPPAVPTTPRQSLFRRYTEVR